MIVTCVYVTVKSGDTERFIEATTKNHNASVLEPGNLRFDLVQQADEPSKFMIYEAYEDEAAAAAHKMTDHYAEWRDTVAGMMAEPRKGVKYNIVCPSDKAKW